MACHLQSYIRDPTQEFELMETWQIVAIAVAAIIIVAAVAWVVYNQRQRRYLRTRFGSEYDQAMAEFGDRRTAETELKRREERLRHLQLRPLSLPDRQRFTAHWMTCQARFVDDPEGALDDADRLLTDIIRARGYASDSTYDRMADISAAYPQHASRYRMAETIVARHQRGEGSTEDLRKAFVHYRELFDEILGGQDEELERAS
jgi:hypothetical protein